jgi:hypothetical protein
MAAPKHQQKYPSTHVIVNERSLRVQQSHFYTHLFSPPTYVIVNERSLRVRQSQPTASQKQPQCPRHLRYGRA